MLVDLDAPYTLPSDAIQFFRDNGYVRLKQVLTADEIALFGPYITRKVHELNDMRLPVEERTTYEKAFLQVMNLWQHDAHVRQFVLGKRLGRIAAELLEVTGVRLYHDQALYKEPSGGFTPAHADQYYWPLASDRTITAWIPLQAVSADMGPLAFYAGSHHSNLGRDMEISDESEQSITRAMQDMDFPLIEQPFELGEVSFHGGWTFHKAGPNLSPHPRAVMTMIYMDEHMRLSAPTNHNQQRDLEQWCPGAQLGEVIATPINPVVYTASA
jgi:ectoine hydroxylase-related dioxygenase (phytanoyl-CoA dioxygenase family)